MQGEIDVCLNPGAYNWRTGIRINLGGRGSESLTAEHAGEPLSRYEVRVEPATGKLRTVGRPRFFENSHGMSRLQLRLFALDALGEGGWLKAMRLEGYAPRAPRRPPALQPALFPYAKAL